MRTRCRRASADLAFASAAGEGEGDLGQCRVAEALAATRDLAAAGILVEAAGAVIVGERPDNGRIEAVAQQFAARGEEQARSEADTLIFGPKIDFVDFAALDEVSGPVGAVGGVAGNRPADLDDEDARATAYGPAPPVWPRRAIIRLNSRAGIRPSYACRQALSCTAVIAIRVTHFSPADIDRQSAHVDAR